MTNYDLMISVSPKFIPFLDPKYDFVDTWYLYGGRDEGKSATLSIKEMLGALGRSMELKSGTVLSCRSTQTSIRGSVLKEIKEVALIYPKLGDYFKIGESFCKTRNNLVRFEFKGTNINSISLKGVQGAFIGSVDEADAMNESAIEFFEPTIRAEGGKVYYCFNPSTKTTPFARQFLARIEGACGRSAEENLYRSFVDYKRRLGVIFGTYRDNYFLSETSARRILREQETMEEEDFDNIYNGRFVIANKRAYYGKKLNDARAAGHIGSFPYAPLLDTYISWDLGMNDLTVAVVFQMIFEQTLNDFVINIIDCVSGNGQPIGWYADLLKSRGYGAAKMFVPHDGDDVRGYTTLETAQRALQACGYNYVDVIPRANGAALRRIQGMRNIFDKLRFNVKNAAVKLLVDELGLYAPKIVNNIALDTPDHAHSDFADAFGIIADVYQRFKTVNTRSRRAMGLDMERPGSKWDW